ncbi:MAG: hypothetical protein H6757_05025 [Candidatus Omnitrophica bacterium]|nr:hypothetical protein [Candidatus Omnitrophota bacterium]
MRILSGCWWVAMCRIAGSMNSLGQFRFHAVNQQNKPLLILPGGKNHFKRAVWFRLILSKRDVVTVLLIRVKNVMMGIIPTATDALPVAAAKIVFAAMGF